MDNSGSVTVPRRKRTKVKRGFGFWNWMLVGFYAATALTIATTLIFTIVWCAVWR